MKLDDVRAILQALNDAEARYLIVGGIAVVAHGYVRYTADLDLVLNLEHENVIRAMTALEKIGYRPLVPVKGADFADAALRQSWIRDKNMIVFQMLNPDRASTRLDVFVEEPFSFVQEYAAARWEEIEGVRSPVVQYSELIRLKRASGRPRDLIDVEQLESIAKSKHP
ncbi:MAG: nucleotidyl transferase AbiEii/AbiGii toxin family protein [Chthoniobacterales bacterium]